jgi:hypothetical protein
MIKAPFFVNSNMRIIIFNSERGRSSFFFNKKEGEVMTALTWFVRKTDQKTIQS